MIKTLILLIISIVIPIYLNAQEPVKIDDNTVGIVETKEVRFPREVLEWKKQDLEKRIASLQAELKQVNDMLALLPKPEKVETEPLFNLEPAQ